MKKFICLTLSILAILCVGCSNGNDSEAEKLPEEVSNEADTTDATDTAASSGLINLADCEIGYELPVYPTCEFDYRFSDGTVFHIGKIKVTLSAKNEVNEGDVLSDNFYPYTLSIKVSGTAEPSEELTENFASGYSHNFTFITVCLPSLTSVWARSSIGEGNIIDWEGSCGVYELSSICFQRIIFE